MHAAIAKGVAGVGLLAGKGLLLGGHHLVFFLGHGSATAALHAAQATPSIVVAHGSSLTAPQLTQIHALAFQNPTLNQDIMTLLQTKIGEATIGTVLLGVVAKGLFAAVKEKRSKDASVTVNEPGLESILEMAGDVTGKILNKARIPATDERFLQMEVERTRLTYHFRQQFGLGGA
jgi:hypothetical protein